MKKVYLAGPISGCTYSGSTNWRIEVAKTLANHNIAGFSPMRGEPPITGVYGKFANDDTHLNLINIRDYNDCKTSDAVLVNFLDAPKVSIGTVMEVAWTKSMQIPVVIVMEKDNIHHHAMLTYNTIVVETLQEGVDMIIQLLNP